MNAASSTQTHGLERVTLAGAEQVAKVGTWRFCPDTGELRWSDNLYRLHGLEPGEVEPGREALLDRTHPDDVARLESWADRVRRGEFPPPSTFAPSSRQVGSGICDRPCTQSTRTARIRP